MKVKYSAQRWEIGEEMPSQWLNCLSEQSQGVLMAWSVTGDKFWNQ